MDDFSFKMPTRFAFGPGSERETGRLAAHYGGTKVLVVYGEGASRHTGALGAVLESLERSVLDCVELGGIGLEPVASAVYEGVSLARDERVDFVIAVGGESVADTAKAIAAGARYLGDFWDLFDGAHIPDEALPLGCVLNAAATGREVSPESRIVRGGAVIERRASSDALVPAFAVLDPELPKELLPRDVARTALGALACLMDSYLVAGTPGTCTDRVAEGIMRSVVDRALALLETPDDLEARGDLLWAAALAQGGIATVGRPRGLLCRTSARILTARCDIDPSSAYAVTLPAALSLLGEGDPARAGDLARSVWGAADASDEDAVGHGIEALKSFAASFGLPATLEELTGTPQDASGLAHDACRRENESATLAEEDVTRLFELMR